MKSKIFQPVFSLIRGLQSSKYSLVGVLVTMVIVAVSVWPAHAATPTFRQARTQRITSGTVNSLAYSSANIAGNLSVVYVSWSNNGNVIVTDSNSNPYTAVAPATAWGSGGAWRSQVFYAKNITAGANTVTATFGTSISSFGKIAIHEYSNIDRVNPIDVSTSAIGTANAMNSGNATTTNAADLIFGAGSSSNSVNSAGSGFTSRSNANGSRTEDKNVTTVGAYNATASQNGNQWVMHMVAFRSISDTTAPTAPTGLTATPASATQVNLAWTPSSDNVGVTGYEVQRCTGATCTNYATLATVSTSTNYIDTGTVASTTYRYRVRATDAALNLSAFSSVVNATTPAGPDSTAPGVPTGVTVTPISTTQLTVSWTASTDNVGVTGYKIYRDGVFVTNNTTTSYQDTGLTPSTSYSYTILAYDAAGNQSAQSAPVSGRTPDPDNVPPSASMTAPAPGSTVSGTSVTVSANASDNVGVTQVEFLLDGVTLGTDTTAPYTVQWNTTTTSNGLHSLSARARDLAGNYGITSGVTNVTVNNSAPPLPPNLMAGWSFDEGSGNSALDVTSNGNNGSLLNNPSWTAGRYGSALSLDGINDQMQVPNSPTINITGNQFTASAWVNPRGGGNDQVVFAKFYNSSMTTPYYQYGLELTGGTKPNFIVGTSTGERDFPLGSALPLGQWSHLAMTYDGTLVRWYLGGNLMSSTASSFSFTAHDTPFWIGSDISNHQFYNGAIDDMRIYNRTLSQTDIQTDMNTPLTAVSNPSAPSVNITSPANNAQVGGTITVTANASDDTGVAGVQFYVDGAVQGPEDTAAPYAANWDTRTASNGAHTISARVRDVSGNFTTSSPVTVNVGNSDYFQNEVLATGFDLPTAMKFLPDGRILVAELRGKIKILPAPYTTPDPTPFLQITNLGQTSTIQQGIFDFALDPNYSANHYYYVFYTASVGGSDHDRLSRFTANANSTGTIAGSEFVLYQDPQVAADEHHGGAVTFANDGKILFTTGEHFQGSPAQDLTSPRGKVLRINSDGTVPTDNPFYDGAGPNYDAIWAYGLRNPYRASYDAPTGRLLIGDVGGNTGNSYEEVNLGARGANYGWPNVEGPCTAPCTSPIYAYNHNNRDAAVTGGFVYHGTGFPAGMEGNYFFGDYAQNWIKRMTFDANGNVTGVYNFEPADGLPDGPTGDVVYLTEGPDGSIYYLDLGYSDDTGTFGVSKLRRIKYVQSNQAPIANASATPLTGPQPLVVNFSSAGSSDPEGQPITYSWDFGDGSPLDTSANPSHTYTVPGQYLARLTVSDGVNSTFSTPVTIQVGNVPTATILTPTDGATFRAGDVINFSGDATDPDETLPSSAFSWTIDFLHDGHVHPGTTVTGRTGSFTIPTSGHDFSGNTRYRLTLTVTDSTGLKDTKFVTIWPQKVNLNFDTAPTGLTLYLDGIAHTAPFTYDTLIGFQHTIDARDQSNNTGTYNFTSWSDGGSQLHTLTVPDTATNYTANYTLAPVPTGLRAAWGFSEGSGTTSADKSGNNNLMTLLNGLAWGTGKNGSGLNFDGTNDYMTAANSSSLDITGNAITISAWINPNSTSTGDQVLIGKHWNTTMTSPYYQYGIELQSNGSRPVFELGTSTGIKEIPMTSLLTKGIWSHLAIVWDGSSVKFYVNGSLFSTSTLSGVTITSRPNPLRVGADASTQQFYKGLLDDLRIYSKAQTQSEIQTDMNTGL